MRGKNRNSIPVFVLLFLLLAHPVGAVEKISLHALFKGKAIVLIDGARRVLSVGDVSPEGVTLISTDTQEERAEIEIAGKREHLVLGVVVSSFAPVSKGGVTLFPDGAHYYADGLINGVSVRFLVDTGATIVAMDGATAKRVGIDYIKTGRRGTARTAAGTVGAYYMKLNSVQVGDITLYNVDAAVTEGSTMGEVLLGMSFLGQLDMKRDSEKLELIQR